MAFSKQQIFFYFIPQIMCFVAVVLILNTSHHFYVAHFYSTNPATKGCKMKKTVWIKIYDAIALERGDIFRGVVPVGYEEELTYDGECIYDDEEALLDEAGLGAYIEPRSNVSWGIFPMYDNTVRFDDKLAAFLRKYEDVNKVKNWRRNLPENFTV